MKLTCKTLKGQHFDIQVEPDAKIQDVKKAIEDAKGKDFPAVQLKLIHQGKVLKDDNSSLQDNNVSEKSFVVVMVVQPPKGAQASSSGAASSQPAAAPAAVAAPPPVAATPAPAAAPAATAMETAAQPSSEGAGAPAAAAVPTTATAAPGTEEGETYVEASAASTLLAGSQLEQTVSQILEMGGGGWDRPTVLRALRAAFNNPERAIEYLYTGIPETAELPPPVSRETAGAGAPPGAAAGAPAPAAAGGNPGVPNVTPFNLFGGQQPGAGGGAAGGQAGALDFLRTNPQFQGLRAMVQTNPGLLQPMLQELGKANPELARLISTHQAEFLRLLNEPPSEGDLLQLAAAAAQGQGQPPPVALNVTPEESEAINRLEAMGFDRQLVIEAFFACDKNEQLAANYLLEHGAEFDD